MLDAASVDPRRVARRPCRGMARAVRGVGDDPVIHVQAGADRQLVPRPHPDSGRDQRRRKPLVTQPNRIRLDRGDLRIGPNRDPGLGKTLYRITSARI
jgi:hypothetical protein